MRLAVAFLLSLWVSGAQAQSPGCTFQSPPCVQTSNFVASTITSLAVSNVSANVAFPAQGSALTALITNNGSALVYVLGGGVGVIVTSQTGTPIDPGQTIAIPQGLNSNLAAITSSGLSNLTVRSGTGVPVLVYGQVAVQPTPRTLVPLDIATVSTGGTAVTALNAGHATAGGSLMTANSAGICVDQIAANAGTVTGTPSSTQCVGQNVLFNLVPSNRAVSVNSTGSNVLFAGQGLQ